MPEIPVQTGIRVLLKDALDPDEGAGHEQRALVVIPDRSAWNDFTKNYHAEMHFVGFPEPLAPLPMRLMFPGIDRTSEAETQLKSMGEERVTGPFVSVLAETTGYRDLVERLGFEDAFSALRATHDVVVARLEDNQQVLDLAESLDFVQSVLRRDETWDAYRQGDRYLTPTGAPDVDDAAHSFNTRVHLPGIDGEYALEADFDTDFPLSRRTLVLVGENGAGKTRLFNSMIEGLQTLPEWETVQHQNPSTFDPRPRFSRLLVFSSTASDPYPLQVPPWRGLDYRFHRMIGHPPGIDDDLSQSLLDCMRSVRDDTGPGSAHDQEVLNEALEPLGIRNNLHVEVAPGEKDLLPEPVRADGRLYLPFFAVKGEQRRLQLQARMVPGAPPKVLLGTEQPRSLSSGEQALLRFATQAVGSLRPGSLFLFDEPETHLHPRYVSLFMSILDRLLEQSRSIALIATHSAYIVREVPSRRVRMVRKDDGGEVSVESPGMQTFGASIDMISQFVFDDLALKHRFQEVVDAWLRNTPDATVEQFRETFRTDLNAETLSYFAQLISDRHSQ